MKKLAWSIIFIGLIIVVSGLTALTVMYTHKMLEFYIFSAVLLLAFAAIRSVIWAINEVMR